MKALSTALGLFLEFMRDRPDFSVGELSQQTGLRKSQVSQILSTFRTHGLLLQDPITRRYSVGLRAFALGSRFVNSHRLTREALPILRELVDRTNLSARLSVLDGYDPLYLLGVEGRMSADAGWRAGTWLPPHASAAGKLLIAYLEPEVQEAIIERKGMPRYTARTLTDPRELQRQLRQIRKDGYALARGELTPALAVVATPVFGSQHQVIGALSLAYAEHLVPAEREQDLVRILHEQSRKLSGRMGSQVYPHGGEEIELSRSLRRAAGRLVRGPQASH